MRSISRRLRPSSGSTFVEFALVGFVALILTVAVFEFARLSYVKTTYTVALTSAGREIGMLAKRLSVSDADPRLPDFAALTKDDPDYRRFVEQRRQFAEDVLSRHLGSSRAQGIELLTFEVYDVLSNSVEAQQLPVGVVLPGQTYRVLDAQNNIVQSGCHTLVVPGSHETVPAAGGGFLSRSSSFNCDTAVRSSTPSDTPTSLTAGFPIELYALLRSPTVAGQIKLPVRIQAYLSNDASRGQTIPQPPNPPTGPLQCGNQWALHTGWSQVCNPGWFRVAASGKVAGAHPDVLACSPFFPSGQNQSYNCQPNFTGGADPDVCCSIQTEGPCGTRTQYDPTVQSFVTFCPSGTVSVDNGRCMPLYDAANYRPNCMFQDLYEAQNSAAFSDIEAPDFGLQVEDASLRGVCCLTEPIPECGERVVWRDGGPSGPVLTGSSHITASTNPIAYEECDAGLVPESSFGGCAGPLPKNAVRAPYCANPQIPLTCCGANCPSGHTPFEGWCRINAESRPCRIAQWTRTAAQDGFWTYPCRAGLEETGYGTCSTRSLGGMYVPVGTGGAVQDSNTCQPYCPSGRHYIAACGCIDACPWPMARSGCGCVCPSGITGPVNGIGDPANVCNRICPSEHFREPSNNTCYRNCPAGTTWGGPACGCVSACPWPMTRSGCGCACPSGVSGPVNGIVDPANACNRICPWGTVYYPSDNSCQTPAAICHLVGSRIVHVTATSYHPEVIPSSSVRNIPTFHQSSPIYGNPATAFSNDQAGADGLRRGSECLDNIRLYCGGLYGQSGLVSLWGNNDVDQCITDQVVARAGISMNFQGQQDFIGVRTSYSSGSGFMMDNCWPAPAWMTQMMLTYGCSVRGYHVHNLTSPISLIWEPRVDIEVTESRTKFPLNPKEKGRWFVWRGSGVTPLIVWDPKRTGTITGAAALFGNHTWGKKWEDGYKALQSLDKDGNGWLEKDELKNIALWFDFNQDGVSDKGEVRSLAAVGVTAIGTRPDRTDAATRSIFASQGFKRVVNGKETLGESVDWFAGSTDEKLGVEVLNKKARVTLGMDSPLGDESCTRDARLESAAAPFSPLSFDPRMTFSGLWDWQVLDDAVMPERLPGGMLGITDEGSTVRGKSVVTTRLAPNAFGLKERVDVHGLTGRTGLTPEGRREMHFVMHDRESRRTESRAWLSDDGMSLRGVSIESPADSNIPATQPSFRYRWVAKRIVTDKKK